MKEPSLRVSLLVSLFVIMAGCASTSPHTAFEEVEAGLEERGIETVHWHTGTEEDEESDEKIRQLLEEELTVESAVQITLLNNRRLQAVYSQLGVAQADLVQAGLLSNPVFSGSILFPLSGGNRELELGITQSFLEIFYIPLRKRVAGSMLEETKLTASVLDYEYRARTAFYKAQASSQRLEMFSWLGFGSPGLVFKPAAIPIGGLVAFKPIIEPGATFTQRVHDAGYVFTR